MITARLLGINNVTARLTKAFPNEVRVQLAEGVKENAQKILAVEVTNAPRATGLLASKLKIHYANRGLSARIGIFKDPDRGFIARFLEFGVKPHVIQAGDKPLAFDGHLAQLVNHPGIQPKHWLLGSTQALRQDMISTFADKLRAAVRKMGNK